MRRLRLGRVLNRGRRDGAHARNAAVRLASGVIDLHRDFRAVLFDAPRQFAVRLHKFIRPQSRNALEARAAWLDDVILGDNQSEAAFGFFFIIADIAFGQAAIFVRKFSEHRRHCQPIFDGHRADLNRRKHPFEFHGLFIEHCLG